MENQNSNQVKGLIITLIILFIISGTIAVAGAVIMTDLGQIFGVSKQLVVSYFLNNRILILISFLALIGAVIINYRIQFMRKWIIGGLCVLWLIAVLSTKYVVPYVMFRTHQYNAEFVANDDVYPGYIEDQDVVYAIDYNGFQKAIPAKYIWQGHIVGADFGDQNILFTYCVIANLAIPYLGELDNRPVDFKVLAQTNSNLLIWDTQGGEIIQQITNTCEFSEKKLSPIPMLEMTWRGYRKLYPGGELFINEWDTPMEKMLNLVFDREAVVYGGKWLFETVEIEDDRLPSKEHIVGFRDDENNKQLAFTRSYIREKGILNTTVGNKKIVIAYYPEYETVAAFNREKDGEVLIIDEIDIFGNTPDMGILDQEFLYSGVFWAVWLYYYPETDLLM
jgi:hypothetical protein